MEENIKKTRNLSVAEYFDVIQRERNVIISIVSSIVSPRQDKYAVAYLMNWEDLVLK